VLVMTWRAAHFSEQHWIHNAIPKPCSIRTKKKKNA